MQPKGANQREGYVSLAYLIISHLTVQSLAKKHSPGIRRVHSRTERVKTPNCRHMLQGLSTHPSQWKNLPRVLEIMDFEPISQYLNIDPSVEVTALAFKEAFNNVSEFIAEASARCKASNTLSSRIKGRFQRARKFQTQNFGHAINRTCDGLCQILLNVHINDCIHLVGY